MVAESKGLILVDTKYEFGRLNDKIILIDEVIPVIAVDIGFKDTYDDRFSCGQEPEKLDKDLLWELG